MPAKFIITIVVSSMLIVLTDRASATILAAYDFDAASGASTDTSIYSTSSNYDARTSAIFTENVTSTVSTTTSQAKQDP